MYNAVTLGRGRVHSLNGSIVLMDNNNNNRSTMEDHSQAVSMKSDESEREETINPSSMPQEERTYVYSASDVPMSEPDLYGQRHPIESDALIQSKLVDFDFQVKQLDRHNCAWLNTTALDLALEKCPHLLTNAFKLWFLRCEVFDASLAAVRYARYWQKRVQVFGPVRSFQRITLELLTEQELEPLRLGALQIVRRAKTNDLLDERDFMYVDPSRLEPTRYTRECAIRAFWFLFHQLLEHDEQVQRRGLVAVHWCAHFANRNRDPLLMRQCLSSILGCMPIRISANHICQPPLVGRIVLAVLLSFVGERIRRRVLVHSSRSSLLSSSDNTSDLVRVLESTYSIPRSYIPSDMGGTLELDVNSWLAEYRHDKSVPT
jgi:CRAL/TRIO domain